MDEWMLNDLLECSVCLDRLDTSSKVLPCQHTFCKKCLEEIVESHKELRCPECRVLVDAAIEDLPPNVLLMRILEGMKNAPKKRGTGASRAMTHGPSASSTPVQNQGVQVHHHHQANPQQQHHSSPAHLPISKLNHDQSSQQTSIKQTILPGQPCARAVYSYTSPEAG
jgi:E3 ubiquitin-protein ligase SH3RF